jgi:hypothetical protein
MYLPTDLTLLNVGVVSGAAGATVTAQLLAAPGANTRYRVWQMTVGPNAVGQAPGNWTMDLTDFPVTVGVGRLARPNFTSGFVWWPGGYAFPANRAVGYALASALAALSVGITLLYTTEDVT